MPAYGSKPFKEAIDYLQQKVPLPTNGWQDVYGQQHDHAFMVAGANKTAIIEDFLTGIQAAIKDGETLHAFQKRFDTIVEKHGWSYHGSRGWRSRLIYETNIRQAYNAGREAQMDEPGFKKLFPYMEYRHSGAENFRPQHKAWDHLTLASDDPFWGAHSPSNGYGCKCKKFPKSERAMRRLGKTGPDIAPADEFKEYLDKRTGEIRKIPLGIDPGFEHTPGQSWLRQSTPHVQEQWPSTIKSVPVGPVAKPPLPAATSVSSKSLMADGLTDEQYVQAFLGEFGEGDLIFKDVLGEPIAINNYLFRGADGKYKVSKDKLRHRYMRLLARAIQNPDEIWAILETDRARPGKYKLKRRYIKRWTLIEGDGAGQPIHGFSAFEYGQGIWTGNTSFTPHRKQRGQKVPDNDAYLERQREGVNLYVRKG
ncbi:PBECR2 nuclease fold domain-containing protein [uncultured Amphritea sp.]|uniref:PBECR2 nuclease fold domain-containing protein n=1 Tax=uncultured Amphritea sp. TaxID=981605 RepID=UPI002628D041|nr:PBECR2 nuclease fold domain-containing protein [uncultured Amphritea sp.]